MLELVPFTSTECRTTLKNEQNHHRYCITAFKIGMYTKNDPLVAMLNLLSSLVASPVTPLSPSIYAMSESIAKFQLAEPAAPPMQSSVGASCVAFTTCGQAYITRQSASHSAELTTSG